MNAETAHAAPTGPSRSDIDQTLRAILRDVLGLDQAQVDGFDGDTGLFGHLPELDSMAVAGLLTEMEDRLDIVVNELGEISIDPAESTTAAGHRRPAYWSDVVRTVPFSSPVRGSCRRSASPAR